MSKPLTHTQRMVLIMKPFPIVTRHSQTAMPWSGTILGDRFYGDGQQGPKYPEGVADADALELDDVPLL